MIQRIHWLAPVLLLALFNPLFAQTEQPVAQAFSKTFTNGDVTGITAFLDEQVELLQTGEGGTFQKKIATTKLSDFLRTNPPASFVLKHQGSSADGQVYAIGQLTTQSGSSFKVLMRAKQAGGQQRIFKIELLQHP